MPITITYDFSVKSGNHHSYVRSSFERFGWEQIGGSTVTYSGRMIGGRLQEDWFNDVAPAIMHFRSYVLKHKLKLNKFTINAASFSIVDYTPSNKKKLGRRPLAGSNLKLKKPTNNQSSAKRLQAFVDSCIDNV
jgi:hypothetical protein